MVQLSAYLFYQIVHSVSEERDACLVHAKSYKKRASDIQDQCLTLLDKSFITPIDREDIQQIAAKLFLGAFFGMTANAVICYRDF